MKPTGKGMGVVIAFGKPKEGPPPLRRMDAEEEEPVAPAKDPARVPTELDQRHEQGEKTMDFGAIGEKYGLDPDSAKAFANDVLEACIRMAGGAKHEEQEPQAAEEYGESDTENYPA